MALHPINLCNVTNLSLHNIGYVECEVKSKSSFESVEDNISCSVFSISEVKNIAPIFLKKKPKAAVNSPVKKVLDPETEKLKRAFLMSGIPAELKQSITATASNVVASYPPLPRDNHVQQKSESRMWSVENVILKTVAETDLCAQIAQEWHLGTTHRQSVTNSLKTDVHVCIISL